MSARTPKEAWVVLGIVVALGLFLRIAYVQTTWVDTPIRADAREYVTYAENLVHHGVLSKQTGVEEPVPDSFRSPGYPLFLAAVMKIAGEELSEDEPGEAGPAATVVLLVQAILGGLLVPLAFLLARRFLPVAPAVAAAALAALSPHLVTASGYLLTETLFAVLVLGGLVLLAGAQGAAAWIRSLAAGLLLGLAWLVNESALPLPFVLAAVAWWAGRRRKRVHLAFLLAFLAIVSAGKVRNAVSVPPGAPTGGQRALRTLSHGTYPGFVHEDPEMRYYPYRDDPLASEYSRSLADFRRIFWSRFRERPGRYLSWYLLEKPWHLWGWDHLQGFEEIYVFPVAGSPYQENPVADATRVALKVLHPLLVLLALAAVPLLWLRRRREDAPAAALALAPLLLFTALGMVFAPWPRYVVPLRPELYAVALWPVSLLISRIRAGSGAAGKRG